jgi:hypothetical protein
VFRMISDILSIRNLLWASATILASVDFPGAPENFELLTNKS